MHKKISKADLKTMESAYWKLQKLYNKYMNDDIPTKYNNGFQGELIGSSIAALDCIFQEYED
jgi:hypothetical protein